MGKIFFKPSAARKFRASLQCVLRTKDVKIHRGTLTGQSRQIVAWYAWKRSIHHRGPIGGQWPRHVVSTFPRETEQKVFRYIYPRSLSRITFDLGGKAEGGTIKERKKKYAWKYLDWRRSLFFSLIITFSPSFRLPSCFFLDASAPLYSRVCPSVRVRRSVHDLGVFAQEEAGASP